MFMKEETADLFTLDQQNAAREVEKILNLRKQEFNGNMIVFQDDESTSEPIFESFEISMQCKNCERLFGVNNYLDHVCEYDENKQLIKTEPNEPFIDIKTSLQILNENNQRIQSMFQSCRNNYESWTETKNGKTKVHYKCNICNRRYVHLAGLTRHMESHENESNVGHETMKPENLTESFVVACKCLSCGRIFRTASEAIEHGEAVHNWSEKCLYYENQLQEAEANGESVDRSKMEESLQEDLLDVIILETVLQCEFCDFLFADVTFLLIHASSHEPTEGFKCNYCDICSRNLKQMTNHWTSECPFQLYESQKHVNVTKLFVCNVCENKFKSLDDLYWHRYATQHFFPRLNIDELLLQVACEKCEEIVDSAESLIQHFNKKHTKKVKRGSTTESDVTCRPYLCEVCGKGYTQSSHLYQHLRFHQGVKPFPCPRPECGRRFTIRPDLNDHIRKCHTGERPYKCLECGKSFLTGSVFYQHRLIHRGERRYACQSCDKRFHRSDALKNHERIHTGDKPFVCQICFKSFRQKGDRDKHCKSRHKKMLNLKEMGVLQTIYEEPSNSLEKIMQIRPVTNNINGIDVITMTK